MQEIAKCNEEVSALENDIKKLVAALKAHDAELDKYAAQLKELTTHLDKANSEQEQVRRPIVVWRLLFGPAESLLLWCSCLPS